MKVVAITGDGSYTAELNDDDSITLEVPRWIIRARQPHHGQVTVEVDNVVSNVVYADFTNGVWRVDRGGELIDVFFSGTPVCPHCLHHHDDGRGPCGEAA